MNNIDLKIKKNILDKINFDNDFNVSEIKKTDMYKKIDKIYREEFVKKIELKISNILKNIVEHKDIWNMDNEESINNIKLSEDYFYNELINLKVIKGYNNKIVKEYTEYKNINNLEISKFLSDKDSLNSLLKIKIFDYDLFYKKNNGGLSFSLVAIESKDYIITFDFSVENSNNVEFNFFDKNTRKSISYLKSFFGESITSNVNNKELTLFIGSKTKKSLLLEKEKVSNMTVKWKKHLLSKEELNTTLYETPNEKIIVSTTFISIFERQMYNHLSKNSNKNEKNSREKDIEMALNGAGSYLSEGVLILTEEIENQDQMIGNILENIELMYAL